MTLEEYINTRYGEQRGAISEFLKDNPHILPQELSRWKKKGMRIHLETGEIYKATSKKVRLKNTK